MPHQPNGKRDSTRPNHDKDGAGDAHLPRLQLRGNRHLHLTQVYHKRDIESSISIPRRCKGFRLRHRLCGSGSGRTRTDGRPDRPEWPRRQRHGEITRQTCGQAVHESARFNRFRRRANASLTALCGAAHRDFQPLCTPVDNTVDNKGRGRKVSCSLPSRRCAGSEASAFDLLPAGTSYDGDADRVRRYARRRVACMERYVFLSTRLAILLWICA